MRSAAAALRLVVCAGALLGPLDAIVSSGGVAAAAERSSAKGWKQEFEDVCSKTQDAMALSTAELRDLAARCDGLQPAIEALEEPLRKVYGRRLQACRDLYRFVLEHRERDGKS